MGYKQFLFFWNHLHFSEHPLWLLFCILSRKRSDISISFSFLLFANTDSASLLFKKIKVVLSDFAIYDMLQPANCKGLISISFKTWIPNFFSVGFYLESQKNPSNSFLNIAPICIGAFRAHKVFRFLS